MCLAISRAVGAADVLGGLAPNRGSAIGAANEVLLVVAAAEERVAREPDSEYEEGGWSGQMNGIAAKVLDL
jgi:hypothetical protein